MVSEKEIAYHSSGFRSQDLSQRCQRQKQSKRIKLKNDFSSISHTGKYKKKEKRNDPGAPIRKLVICYWIRSVMESGLQHCGAATTTTGGGAGGAGGADGAGAGLSNLVPRCSHLTDAWGRILGMCER